MSDTSNVTEIATAKAKKALVNAAERQSKIAARKAEYRLKWQRMYREFREQAEVDRLQRACEVVQARIGRPQTITDETINTVLALHAEGENLLQAASIFGISRSQLIKRCNEDDSLRARLVQAREDNAHAKVDGAWVIARAEPDVDRAKLLVELAQWEVAKVLPHLYGERVKLEATEGVVFSLNIGQVVERKQEKLVVGDRIEG